MKLTSTLSALLVASVAALDTPTITSIKVGEITAVGSGCPAGSALTTEGPSGWITTFSAYSALIGKKTKPNDNLKECNVTLSANLPKGWRISPTTAISRYWTSIESGVQLSIATSAFYSSGSDTVRSSSFVSGPLKAEGISNANFTTKALYSPCGGKVSLTYASVGRLSVKEEAAKPAEDSILSVDSYDYSVKFEKC